jgi:serine/threonine-protein kinase
LPQHDSENFRDLICRLLPGLRVREVARPSGQRIVYFGDFDNATADEVDAWGVDARQWGNVVVKISSGISPDAITYLQREIHILNELDSEFYPTLHFDNVYAKDPLNEEPLAERLFITIEEYIPSKPLSDCVCSYQTEEAVIDLLFRLTEALRILWNQKPPLVHRDIKPDNILIKADGTAVIIDLGIVREEGSDGVTRTEWLWGPCTPQFSSPEQARNDKRNISFKSDVFALGTLAYVLITKSNPFQPEGNTSVVDVLDNVLNYVPPTLAETAGVSQEFSDLVFRMMQKEPYRRPRTPDSLIDALSELRERPNAA